MMSANLHNDVTWWRLTGKGEFTGFTFADPLVLRGRWEDKAMLVRTPAGEEVTSRAVVYLEQDITVGDYIALGDESGVADPTSLPLAFRVMQFQKVANLQAIRMTRSAYV